MRSSKNRSRSKANRPRSIGNIINRVFDSSGPEGKVRGTPQQIIEKYLILARDAQLSNDRVAAENFLQHAEHYTRMLGEAQRELAAEQEARQSQYQQGQNGQGNGNGHGQGQGGHRDRRDDRGGDRPSDRGDGDQPYLPDSAAFALVDDDSGLVETPEARRERTERGERGGERGERGGDRGERGGDRNRRTPREPRPEGDATPAAPADASADPAAPAGGRDRRGPRPPRGEDRAADAPSAPAVTEAEGEAPATAKPRAKRPAAPRKPAPEAPEAAE